jgi:hypothetical protein
MMGVETKDQERLAWLAGLAAIGQPGSGVSPATGERVRALWAEIVRRAGEDVNLPLVRMLMHREVLRNRDRAPDGGLVFLAWPTEEDRERTRPEFRNLRLRVAEDSFDWHIDASDTGCPVEGKGGAIPERIWSEIVGTLHRAYYVSKPVRLDRGEPQCAPAEEPERSLPPSIPPLGGVIVPDEEVLVQVFGHHSKAARGEALVNLQGMAKSLTGAAGAAALRMLEGFEHLHDRIAAVEPDLRPADFASRDRKGRKAVLYDLHVRRLSVPHGLSRYAFSCAIGDMEEEHEALKRGELRRVDGGR